MTAGGCLDLHASPLSSREGHAVRLDQPQWVGRRRRSSNRTHRFGETPGSVFRATALGRGSNHRSVFHCSASSPQMCVLVLAPRIPIITSQPFGTGISSITVPSRPTIGVDRDNTVSFLALRRVRIISLSALKNATRSLSDNPVRWRITSGHTRLLTRQSKERMSTHIRIVSLNTALRYGNCIRRPYVTSPSRQAVIASVRSLSCATG